jgi:copper resistance protein B
VGGLLLIPQISRGEEKSELYTSLIVDQLEYRSQEGDDLGRVDLEAWAGGDTNRIWLRSEAETRTTGPSDGRFEGTLFYARHVAPFVDLLVGVREDVVYGAEVADRERTLAALSLDWLVPGRIDLEPNLFVSDEGDVSTRITATGDLFLTQRLIAQARFEVNASASDARAFGIQSGFNDVELGLRLRYELRREFAPYVGVSWVRRLGDTADLAKARGERESEVALAAGIRFWF